MIWTIPSTTLSVSILNSTLTSDPLFGRTCLLICHDDTRRDLRHPAKIYSPECVEGEFCELRSALKGHLGTLRKRGRGVNPRRSTRCAGPAADATASP